MFGVFPLVQVLYRSLAGNQNKDLKGLETWRSALSEIHRCLPQTLEVSFRETKNLKVKLLLIHFLNLLFGFKRGAVHVGWKPKAASRFLAFFLTVYVNRLAQITGKLDIDLN